MPELELPERQATDTQMLTGFWYRALPADRVHRNRLHKATLLEIPLVIGRDRLGQPFALRDACPHRGMPLNTGQFDGENLECPYHGWQFDVHNGQCQLIPSLTSDQTLKVDRIYAGSYPCEEQDTFIWVYIPDPGPQGAGFTKPSEAPDGAPRIEKFSAKCKLAYLQAEMPVSIDHGIIGLMDPAHGPFVHQAWWWRSRHSIHEKKKNFEPIPNGFRMSAHTPSSNSAPYKLLRLCADADAITTTIDFVLPNVRTETIRAGKYWFSSLTTVTPITRSHCRIDVVAAWNLFRWLPFGPELLKFVFAKFVEQDRRTMEMQAEGLKHNPHLLLIDDADRPAKWYFQLKAAHLEAKRTGAEMKHPMSGPVTLKWRS
ncbi:Rieske 2Fe-2S domain protein [Candidatus Sulfotelmatobacter kueseliae]|uniref:Rieske 2Fe-2S domain protein n=1 Tax=Candidatus Sulfotelmatobacter kueseliae TaxID=2042962 RepID=A0A2U3JV97_9BACT|nr:Rieske 2Fe-2S domain protein [Candidatus Sulfotelmatobacter kueseliae]